MCVLIPLFPGPFRVQSAPHGRSQSHSNTSTHSAGLRFSAQNRPAFAFLPPAAGPGTTPSKFGEQQINKLYRAVCYRQCLKDTVPRHHPLWARRKQSSIVSLQSLLQSMLPPFSPLSIQCAECGASAFTCLRKCLEAPMSSVLNGRRYAIWCHDTAYSQLPLAAPCLRYCTYPNIRAPSGLRHSILIASAGTSGTDAVNRARDSDSNEHCGDARLFVGELKILMGAANNIQCWGESGEDCTVCYSYAFARIVDRLYPSI